MKQDLSFWQVLDAMASAHGGREYLVSPQVRLTYAEVRDHALNLAGNLAAHGCGVQRERDALQPYESGQDHVGLLAGNRPEYVEAMFGALRARCAPVNLNYRYVASELNQVMRTARVTALFYESDLADTVREAIADLPPMKMLVEIGGDSPLIPGAIAYRDVVSRTDIVPQEPRPEDLCVACTGGTTGLPKAVLWRQCDLFSGMAGDTHTVTLQPIATLDDLIRFADQVSLKALVCQPLMHFAGFGNSVLLASSGATMCLPEPTKGFDPAKALAMVERERVARLGMVGDAFARPLIEELKRGKYDLSSLRVVSSGGAALTPGVKAELARVLGNSISIREGMGSSEGGLQGGNVWTGNDEAGVFNPGPRMRLISADRSRELERDETKEQGWLATIDRVPLGYLNEPAKTAETFPTINGRRYSIPGDRAQWRDDGKIKVLGRDSLTINSGGEKVFAEEVEDVIRRDPRVDDVLVVGRPSERWGQEVVALVVPRNGETIDRESVNRDAAKHLARYKLPKALFVVPAIERTPAGKPDYRWARTVATGGT